jgi:hypothetical protein
MVGSSEDNSDSISGSVFDALTQEENLLFAALVAKSFAVEARIVEKRFRRY